MYLITKVKITWKRVRICFLISLLLVLILSNACAGINKYAKAQDYFNTAVEADTAKRLVPEPEKSGESALIYSSKTRSNYALALKYIDEIINDNKEKNSLEEAGLLGNALTIKAISEWKIGNHTEASETAKEALNFAETGQLYPRDHALMKALPGLIKADQAFYHTMSAKSEKTYKSIYNMIYGTNGAKKDFKAAESTVSEKHPVRVYLMMSEMAAVRTLIIAAEKKIMDPAELEQTRDILQQKHAEPLIEKFKKTIADQKLNAQGDQWQQVIEYWEILLGV